MIFRSIINFSGPIIIMALSYALNRHVLISDGDTFWHLATGRLILEQGLVPTTDSFSFNTQGKQWVNINWFSQIILYTCYHYLGYNGIFLIVNFAIYFFSYFYFKQCKKLKADIVISIAFYCITFICLFHLNMARPQAFSVIFFTSICFLVGWDTSDKPICTRKIILLATSLILWNQMHGGVICGYLVLALILAGSIIQKGKLTYLSTREIQIFSSIILSLCTFAFHPHGLNALLHIIFYSSTIDYRYFSWINELKPLTTENLYFLILIDLPLLIVSHILLKKRKTLKLKIVIPFIFFVLLSHRMVRFLPFFFIFASPFMVNIISRHFIKKNFTKYEDLSPPYIFKSLYLSFIVLPLLLHFIIFKNKTNIYFLETQFPVHALTYLDSKNKMADSKLFVEYSAAGYAIWEAHKKFKVFIDGRGDLHSGNDTLRDYLAITELNSDWEFLLHKYDIHFVLMPSGSRLINQALIKGWNLLYRDAQFEIIEKPRT